MIRVETPTPWHPVFEEAFSNSMTYDDYWRLVQELSASGRSSGSHPTEGQIEITRLNHRRMKRWHKTLELPLDVRISLSHLDEAVNWLVLTESWCGDAAHALPVMQAMSVEQPLIRFRLAMRDAHPDLMDRFLTRGTRSIPKVISVTQEDFTLLGSWGPRPEILQQRVAEEKQRVGTLTAEFKQDLQTWYNTNKGVDISRELLKLLPLE